LFRGRGAHPKTGKLKQRCYPESVGLNCSFDAAVPICPIPGHSWQSVRHDPTVTWLCGWNENVQNQNKYVMLAASSSFKGQSDLEKYAKAIQLKYNIHKIRADYTAKIRSSAKEVGARQLGVAMWVIDKLALRVGGEKGDDEADTVGCCSLRKEHLKFNPDPNSFEIELKFLGKDSMLYQQTIQFAQYGDLGKQVYQCLQSFCAKKSDDEDVFETLDPPKLNSHLSSLMKGLTAKVFRTYNASVTLEQELPSVDELEGLNVAEKVLRYNAANRQVAILCNHQRTVSKATELMFENLQEKLTILQEQKRELISWKEHLEQKSGGTHKRSKKHDVNESDDEPGHSRKKTLKEIPLLDPEIGNEETEHIKQQIKDAEEARDRAKSTDEKLSAAQALENAKTLEKADRKRRLLEKHFFKNMPSVESINQRIEKWSESIRKLEVDIRNRDENKEVALGTSKINYMDPRITVAWCKRCEVPIDKVFARTLRDKFNWAMAVSPDWKFE
jgi:DNA topoisomerase I